MFNESNVDNRLRHFVRGRVIVATTSAVVEFLEDGLKHSYPLYNFAAPPGRLAVFMVELSGYLTFDTGSYVKVSEELNPFTRAHFDPTQFAYCIPADGSVIQSVSFNYAAGNASATFAKVFVVNPDGSEEEKDVYPITAPASSDAFGALVHASFPVNSLWKGPGQFFVSSPPSIE